MSGPVRGTFSAPTTLNRPIRNVWVRKRISARMSAYIIFSRSFPSDRVPDLHQDRGDDVLQAEVVGVDDDRVLRGLQGCYGALGVDSIPQLHLSAHGLLVDRLTAALVLSGAPAHLLREAGGEEELVVGIGEDHRADVAAGHDHSLIAHSPLLVDERLADPRSR